MPKVLIADPSSQVREVLAATFAMFGWQCAEAADGDEALETVRRELPDIILLEVVLPHKNGWDVLRSVKADPMTKDIPVIVLSGWPNVQHDERLRFLRPWRILNKPFRPTQLMREVNFLVESKGDSTLSSELCSTTVIGDLALVGVSLEQDVDANGAPLPRNGTNGACGKLVCANTTTKPIHSLTHLFGKPIAHGHHTVGQQTSPKSN